MSCIQVRAFSLITLCSFWSWELRCTEYDTSSPSGCLQNGHVGYAGIINTEKSLISAAFPLPPICHLPALLTALLKRLYSKDMGAIWGNQLNRDSWGVSRVSCNLRAQSYIWSKVPAPVLLQQQGCAPTPGTRYAQLCLADIGTWAICKKVCSPRTREVRRDPCRTNDRVFLKARRDCM